MAELIEDSCVEGTVITSRNFQEAFRIQEGESHYAILAGCIEISQQQIDMFANFCGTVTGYAAINKRRQEVYYNQNNGKMTNWINRNIYQDPMETKTRHFEEEVIGTVTSTVTEWLIKKAARGVYNYATKKANYQAIEQVYSFLNNYALTDADISNGKRTQLELAKIRNGLPLSDVGRKKIYESNKGKAVIGLEDIPAMSVLNNNTQLCETLAYQLFDLYCQKFGDDDGILAKELEKKNFSYTGMNTLLSYYDYLGFTGNHAKEMIRVNANRYDTICRDQAYYLKLGRMIIRNFSLDIPDVDIYKIREHCSYMAQYDPYQLRRKKVQNVGIGTIKGLAGLLVKRPDIVLNGGSLALSQFQLEDGDIPTIMQREFEKEGIKLEDFDLMLNQAKKITEKSKHLISKC